jgi:hypothetical protein
MKQAIIGAMTLSMNFPFDMIIINHLLSEKSRYYSGKLLLMILLQ